MANIIKRITGVVITLICMTVIFSFSAEDSGESTETSISVTEMSAQILIQDYDKLEKPQQQLIVENLNPFIRKLAHFSLYMLLGTSLYFTARSFAPPIKKKAVAAITVGAAYAVIDEIHQIFVPGRSAQITDVLIDTSGIITAVLIYWLITVAAAEVKKSIRNKRQEQGKSYE